MKFWQGNPVPPRRLFRLAILAVIGVAAFLWVARGGLENRLTVENRSRQTLISVRITVAGESITFRDVQAGDNATSAFPHRGDNRFIVAGRLADGTVVHGTFARAATGTAGERERFIVLPGGSIEFR